MIKLTLGYDSDERKRTPLLKVCFGYFAAAMAGLTRHAVRSNEKHNKGEPVHWARGKSMDHDECSLRHLVDTHDIRAWLKRNPTHPQREEVLTMLEHELDAKVWRAAAESQEFYEEFRDAPLSAASVLPPDENIDYPEETFDDLVQEFNAPGDPAKLPHIVDGTPYGANWAIVNGIQRIALSIHSSYADAESVLREMLAPLPVNTPEELAELERARGKVVLVAGPGLVDGGELRTLGGVTRVYSRAELDAREAGHDFPLFEDSPVERGNGVDSEAGLERCGHMSSTKRVCERLGGHPGMHADHVAHW